MSDFRAEYAAYQSTHGTPDRIELLLPDINAVLRGKWIKGTDADKLAEGLVRLPISTAAPNIMGEELPETGLGITAGDPDGIMRPIAGTLAPVPWAEGHVAQVLVEMEDVDGRFGGLSTRAHLQSMLDRFDARGLTPVVATELEFYIIQPRETPDEAPRPPEHAPLAQNYELNVLDRTAEITNEIQAAAEAQGLPTESLIAEYGPGQYEINFRHGDAMAAADMAVLFRRLVRGVTRRHDLRATFMAKPYGEHPGNGMHVHASLVDGAGNNILSAETGISDTLAGAVGGVLETMREMQAVLAPHLNSYRRFAPGSFSPCRPDWGRDHRGAAIRLPETQGKGARLEHRIAGADVNPYMALTAILGGMLHGLDNPTALPAPLDDDQDQDIAPLTHDWRRAVDLFCTSGLARDWWGERFHDIFCTLKYDEIEKLTALISPIEYRMYLGRI